MIVAGIALAAWLAAVLPKRLCRQQV